MINTLNNSFLTNSQSVTQLSPLKDFQAGRQTAWTTYLHSNFNFELLVKHFVCGETTVTKVVVVSFSQLPNLDFITQLLNWVGSSSSALCMSIFLPYSHIIVESSKRFTYLKKNTNSLLLIYAFPTVLDLKAHLNVSAAVWFHFTLQKMFRFAIVLLSQPNICGCSISPIRFYFGSVDAPLIFGVIFAFVVRQQTFCILNFRTR